MYFFLQIAAVLMLIASPSHAEGIVESFFKSLTSGANPTSTSHQPTADSDAVSLQAVPSQSSDQSPGIPIDSQTSDSSFLVNETVDGTSVLSQISITLRGSEEKNTTVYVPVNSGQISKRIYFLYGPGIYFVSIYHSNNPSRQQSPDQITYFKSLRIQNTDTRDLRYLLPTGDVQSDAPEVISLARNITANAQNDADKALAIHDWVARNIKYDTESYFNDSYKTKVYDALGAIKEGISVCQGYSSLFAALARAVGLRAKVIHGAIADPNQGQTWEKVGTSQPHAWNEVLVNDRWIVVDTTWDSGNVDFQTHQFSPNFKHNYYDPTPENFALDHRKLSESLND